MDLTELENAMIEGSIVLPCGCTVELDGTCFHNNQSPLLIEGLI